MKKMSKWALAAASVAVLLTAESDNVLLLMLVLVAFLGSAAMYIINLNNK